MFDLTFHDVCEDAGACVRALEESRAEPVPEAPRGWEGYDPDVLVLLDW